MLDSSHIGERRSRLRSGGIFFMALACCLFRRTRVLVGESGANDTDRVTGEGSRIITARDVC